MIIILGAQQRSLLTMASKDHQRFVSLSLCLSLALHDRILFYISIISLFSSSSSCSVFFCPENCPALVSVICHSSLIYIPHVFLAIWENCIIPALSRRFSFIFQFSFLAPAKSDILCLDLLSPYGKFVFLPSSVRKNTIDYPRLLPLPDDHIFIGI